MEIKLSKSDVIWGYIAKFFQIGAGFITLPFILSQLPSEEIGLNYLMLTVSSLVALLDFGFAPQFGRNFTYVNSGAQKLLKEGVQYGEDRTINYYLLSVLLKTARYVYRRLSLICLFAMLTFGTLYIYSVTNGFSTVENSVYIWILFSFSTYFNIYFSYYNSLLTGSGKIAEVNKIAVFSKSVYLILCVSLLYMGFGLFAVVIANFVSPFVSRICSYRVYFTVKMKEMLSKEVNADDIKEMFDVIWYNAKKLGVNFLGSYAINKSGLFIVGLFLPLDIVASYGLLIQFTTIVQGVAQTLFMTCQPKFANYRVLGDKESFKKLMYVTTIVYWIIMILGFFTILLLGPIALSIVNSKTMLPPMGIMSIYMIAVLLEGNHSNFATLIVTGNKVPFVKAALISGSLIVILTIGVLAFTELQLMGVILVQLLVQLSYNNWKWPLFVLKEFDLSYTHFIRNGISYVSNYYKKK